jgi:hypothetical protein
VDLTTDVVTAIARAAPSRRELWVDFLNRIDAHKAAEIGVYRGQEGDDRPAVAAERPEVQRGGQEEQREQLGPRAGQRPEAGERRSGS